MSGAKRWIPEAPERTLAGLAGSIGGMPAQSHRWTPSRYGAFLGVLVAHLALIAALLLTTAAAPPPEAAADSVQLLPLAPPNVPTIKAPHNPMQELRAGLPIVPPLHLA